MHPMGAYRFFTIHTIYKIAIFRKNKFTYFVLPMLIAIFAYNQ